MLAASNRHRLVATSLLDWCRMKSRRGAGRDAEPLGWAVGFRGGDRREVRMSLQPVRLMHSGDWHLETPVNGVAEVPSPLREPFVDAPYLAAERVVQAALDHRVDLLVLTGNLLPLESACPYSFEFLLRQFQRLAAQQIDVYWLGGETDDVDLWPAPLRLPENVHRFPAGRLHQFDHRRDDKVVVRLIGQSSRGDARSHGSDFAGGGDGIPRVAVTSGSAAKRSLENKGVDYWALGGERRHHVLLHGATTAVHAGSPQGRGPDDTDAHGAVLVELECGRTVTQLIETDLWRWRREQLQASELTSLEDVQAELTRRLQDIPVRTERFRSSSSSSSGSGSGSGFGWLLVWSIHCRGELAWRLHERKVHQRLLESLRQRATSDARWTMKIEIEPSELPAEWWDEDTVLGDFLRAVQRCQEDPESWQGLAAYLPDVPERDEMLRCLRDVDDEQRQRLWHRVAAWGADLLHGEVDIERATAAP
jgi:exonuclease SbcD